MKPISITYSLSFDDCMNACGDHWRLRGRGTNRLMLIALIMIGAGIAMSFISEWAYLAIAVGSMILAFLLIRRVKFHRGYKRQCENGLLKGTLEVTDSKLRAIGKTSEIEHDWESLESYDISDDFLFLYKSPFDFYAIPIGVVPPNEYLNMLDMIKSKLSISK